MWCYETGKHEAVHLDALTLDLATDIHDCITALKRVGHGTGSIVVGMVNGTFPHIDVSTRMHRKCKKTRLERF